MQKELTRNTDPDHGLLRVIRRLSPTMPRGFVPQGDTELSSLGLDSLALLELFIELEESFGVAIASMKQFANGRYTYGAVCALVDASSSAFDSSSIPS